MSAPPHRSGGLDAVAVVGTCPQPGPVAAAQGHGRIAVRVEALDLGRVHRVEIRPADRHGGAVAAAAPTAAPSRALRVCRAEAALSVGSMDTPLRVMADTARVSQPQFVFRPPRTVGRWIGGLPVSGGSAARWSDARARSAQPQGAIPYVVRHSASPPPRAVRDTHHMGALRVDLPSHPCHGYLGTERSSALARWVARTLRSHCTHQVGVPETTRPARGPTQLATLPAEARGRVSPPRSAAASASGRRASAERLGVAPRASTA